MNLHQATISMTYQPLLGQAADGPPLSDEGVATTGADGTGGATTPAAGQQGGGDFLLLMLIPMVVLMLVFSVFGQRKEKKKRDALMSSIKKHDRVRTIGGVIGAIVEVKTDTVVLKVDESSNTRMTFSRDAVQQVLDSSDTTS
ncbi:MAG: preprotein translocase subunit YajC [Phycisphaera sp.]|nr:preprotein translocase subunit YajC [Phycisphaera sp.]